MPGWEETENEIRLRIREPDLFNPDSFFTKDLQASPRNYAVFGRLKGEETSTIQALRFPKAEWTMDAAQKWFEEHKEGIEKSQPTQEEIEKAQEVPLAFFEKSNLMVQSLEFAEKAFNEKAVKEWLVSKNMDIATLKKSGDSWLVDVRPESQFIQGSIRDIIIRSGIKATVGLLKKESISKKVPDRFALKSEDLSDLCDLDIQEVTLTRAPIVGKMAEFRVVKNVDAVEEYHSCVPILKVSDDEKKQVGAYVLVPNLPDAVGDIVSQEEIEKAAHGFLKNLANKEAKGTGSGLEHVKFNGIGYPIESFVDSQGMHGVPGGWWLTTQVTNPDVWQRVKKGEIVGYSIGGNGRRRKAQVSTDLPVAKSEDIADTVVSRIMKIFGIKKGDKDITPLVSMPQGIEKSEKEESKMNLELLKKYDMKPSEAEAMEKSGIDLEKAVSSMESFAKAINFNFSLEGIGYTTKKMIDIVRNGQFGQWPTTQTAWNVNAMKACGGEADKAAMTHAIQAPQISPMAPKDEGKDIATVTKSIMDQVSTQVLEPMNKILEAVSSISARVETLENARGIRKSVNTDAIDTKNEPEQPTFDASDKRGISYRKAQQVLKAQGMIN